MKGIADVSTAIHFVWVIAKCRTCTIVSVNGTLVKDKICTFPLESMHFIYLKCPIYAHSAKCIALVETKQIIVSANGFSKKILDFRNHFMNNSITKNTLFKMYPKICFMIRPKLYFSSRRVVDPSGNFTTLNASYITFTFLLIDAIHSKVVQEYYRCGAVLQRKSEPVLIQSAITICTKERNFLNVL